MSNIAPPVYHDIPQELKDFNNWLTFKSSVTPDGRNTKVPCHANLENSSFYSLKSYNAAQETQQLSDGKIAGVGFGFNKGETGVVGIDFDHVVVDGEILPEVRAILDQLDSYTEYSISGDGLHTFIISKKNDLAGKIRIADAFGPGTGLEFFKSGCFMTVSGRRLGEYGTIVKSNKDTVLASVVKTYRKKEAKARVASIKSTRATAVFGDVGAFVDKLHLVGVETTAVELLKDGSWKIKLAQCPWGGGESVGVVDGVEKKLTHSDGPDDAVIFFRHGQTPVFYCFHTTCSENGWKEFCKRYPELPTGNFIDEYNSKFCIVEHGSQVLVARRGEDAFYTAKNPAAFFSAQLPDYEEMDDGTRLQLAPIWFASKDAARFPGGFVYDPGEKCGPGCVNMWRGFAIEEDEKGVCDLFYDHWLNVFCNGDRDLYEWTRMWFADIFQNPGEIPCGSAIIAKGEQGIGKSIIADVFGLLLGSKAYCEVTKAEDLFAKHNVNVVTALLVSGAEITFAGDKRLHNQIKGAVTAKQNTLEAKFKDAVHVPAMTRYFITTNADEAIPAERTERRFLILDVPSTYLDDPKHFDPIWDQLNNNGGLGRLMYDMKRVKIDRSALRRPPKTEALQHEKEAAMEPVARWLDHKLAEEHLPGGDDLWPQSVPKHMLYEDYKAYCFSNGYYKQSVLSGGMFVRKLMKMQVGFAPRSKSHKEKVLLVEDIDSVRDKLRRYVVGG